MTENPRLWLAWMWITMALHLFSAAANAHTAALVVAYAIGTIVSPILAFLEFRQGMRERKLRKLLS